MPHGTFDVQNAAIEKAYASAKKDNDFIVIFIQFLSFLKFGGSFSSIKIE